MTTFSDEQLRGFLDQVTDIAEAAGEAAMAHYRDVEVDVEYKDDDSPLTAADLDSNGVIEEGLADIVPELPVLSEESTAVDYDERSGWDGFWLVDPLDGTKEFLKKNGEFTVNIALIEQGEPILGVVRAPALETTYFAAEGLGAFKQDDGGEPEVLTMPDRMTEPVTVVVSRSHINDETRAFVDRLEQDYEVDLMPKGSSLKLCMVAEDAAQIYPRLGPTMEWDTGAAHCLVDQAGGGVDRQDGTPLAYNKEDLLNPYFIAYTHRDAVPFDG
jgi:3'(2'), 5'-bisphosphate nucleotidase